MIGAMQLNAMMRYTQADSLLIVGNRFEAHKLALEAGAAVLITGGFDTDDSIKQLANEKNCLLFRQAMIRLQLRL